MGPDYRPVPYPSSLVSDAERRMMLAQVVNGFTNSGWRLVGGDSYSAALTRPPRRTNHVLHLLLTVLTCGGWGIVWLILSVLNIAGPARVMHVWVDGYGHVRTQ
jgi:hypothetical protein